MMTEAADDIRDPEATPSQTLTAEVIEARWVARDMIHLHLMPAADMPALNFFPGQYVRLAFPGLPRRDYSLAGPPGRERLEFLIKTADSGHVSTYLRHHIQPGDQVQVEGPFGDAYWHASFPEPLLCIAGGSGLAPMKAIAEAALAAQHPGPIALYVGVKTEAELCLENHFQALDSGYKQFTFVPVISDDPEAKARRIGSVGQVAADDHGDLSETRIYIAGPDALVTKSLPLLRTRGARGDRLFADSF